LVLGGANKAAAELAAIAACQALPAVGFISLLSRSLQKNQDMALTP
jgi:hypothetical protein